MKHLSLQQAMLGMRVILTDTGMLIKSPAGSAEYDLKGRRTKVNGYPEYFPGQLRVKDKRTPEKGRVTITTEGIEVCRANGSVAWRTGRLGTHDSNGKQYAAAMGVGVKDDKNQVQFLSDRFAVHDGQAFINDAFLKAGGVTSAALADKDGKETGGTRTRTMRISYASNRQRIEDIVDDYLTGEASELRNEMVEELVTLIAEPEPAAVGPAESIIDNAKAVQAQTEQQNAAIATLSSAIASIGESIRDGIRNELKPGGLLWTSVRNQ